MKPNDLLQRIKIASPCPARWNDMRGDEKVRFCAQCQKNVYNLSAMTPQASEELIKSTEGRLCARLYRRNDGTVLTANCPVGVARIWGFARTVLSAMTVTILGIGSILGAGTMIEKMRGRSPSTLIPGVGRSTPIMGKVTTGMVFISPASGNGGSGYITGDVAISPPFIVPATMGGDED